MYDKARLVEAHQPRWAGFSVWLAHAFAFYALQAAIAWAIYDDHIGLALLLILPLAYVMHAHVLALHEAAHGTLLPVRPLNEAVGVLVGLYSFTPLALFRIVHHYHHIYLTSERDEEMWPFVDPSVPRAGRLLAAAFELTLGLLYMPALLLRCFLRPGTPIQDPRLRRRIWAELALIAVFWAAVLSLVAHFGLWRYFVLVYLLPALLAGDLQTLRKYVEHMGMTGTTVLGVTRSIAPAGPLGRLVARSLFNINYHGIHHRYARMHQTELPAFAELLRPAAEAEVPPYPTYFHAAWDMLQALPDPRMGGQWRSRPAAGRRPRFVHFGAAFRASAMPR